MSPAVQEKPSKYYIESLATRIMRVKDLAERADCEKEYSEFMKEFHFLKERWKAVAGNAVIGIKLPHGRQINNAEMRKAA